LQPLPQPGSPQQRPRASDAHSTSHEITQQLGSVLHTTAQQVLSLHPPLACASKHDPLHGQRQVANGRQVVRASVTQSWSHLSVQHEGSCAHTPLQHATSSHPGLEFARRQSPLPGQVLAAMHTTSARDAHASSHATRQHSRLTLHTDAAQSRLAQPLPPCAARQSPMPDPVGGSLQLPSPAPAALKACCTQIASHCTLQQNGSSTSQTTSQHAPDPVSSQPGRKLGTKQGRVPVLPHVDGAVPHSDWAMDTHRVSHASVQQKTSAAHTVSQHARFAHPGVTCDTLHSPENGDPHPSHSEDTSFTQTASHPIVQHSGRALQTASQQPGSSHPADGCGTRQLPDPTWPHAGFSAQKSRADATHDASQRATQQNGSDRHTLSQHARRLHPGAECSVKQSAAGPPPPHTQLTVAQKVMASDTQVVSHRPSQQKGSIAQTVLQHSASLQKGVLCERQQLAAWALPQASSWHTRPAYATHDWSHTVVQHVGSTAHTVLQQRPLLQYGVECGMKQLPASLSPHEMQVAMAIVTQPASHPVMQQLGSRWQTLAQQSVMEQ